MKTKILSGLSCLLAALLLLGMTALCPMKAAASGLSVTPQSSTIYALDEWAQDYLSIPSDYPQSVQLQISGASSYTCSVVQGTDIVEVSSAGLVTPKATVWYWNGSIGTSQSTGAAGETTTVDYTYGTATVRVWSSAGYVDVSVTLAEYADAYADAVMDAYLAENITDDMTVYEKTNAICAFVASYDYSASYSSATGMIVSGGGDCWSSTNTIVKMCTKLGIHAWARKANKDPGAGSGHYNAMVEGDGTYYLAEAGYVGTAPRSYTVTEHPVLYSYKTVSGGIEIYQYDGDKSTTTELSIPSEIDGKTVLGLSSSFLTINSKITKITLPDTLTYLGSSAFNSCTALKTLNLPASLTSIGSFALTNDPALTELSCDSDNPSYTVENGILYDKAKTKVIAVPTATSVSLPDTVTEVGYYSFYYNKALTQVTLPDSVTSIAEGGFTDCIALKSVRLSSNLTSIGNYAFADCFALETLVIPESVTSFGEAVFDNTNVVLYVVEGSAAQTYAEENSIEYQLYTPADDTVSDQNGDGEVDVLDVMALAAAITAGTASSSGDFNGDGEVDVQDVMALASTIVGEA